MRWVGWNQLPFISPSDGYAIQRLAAASEAHNRSTIGWVRSYEVLPRLHAHATLLAASPIDSGPPERAWQQVAGIKASTAAAVVEPFKKGITGFAVHPEDAGAAFIRRR